jgi:hypothetical protein
MPGPQIQSSGFAIFGNDGNLTTHIVEALNVRDRRESLGSRPCRDFNRRPPVATWKSALACDSEQDDFRSADARDLRERSVGRRLSAACTEDSSRGR